PPPSPRRPGRSERKLPRPGDAPAFRDEERERGEARRQRPWRLPDPRAELRGGVPRQPELVSSGGFERHGPAGFEADGDAPGPALPASGLGEAGRQDQRGLAVAGAAGKLDGEPAVGGVERILPEDATLGVEHREAEVRQAPPPL